MNDLKRFLMVLPVVLYLVSGPDAGAQIIGEPSGSGPMPGVVEARPDLPGHTVYRPESLPRAPIPLFVWGNGGCSNNGLAHAAYLREIASHGYFVVSLGVPGGPATPPPADDSRDPTQAEQMIEAIEWAMAETAREGGDFQDRIDVSRIAVGGHSCGGLQALAVSHDPRVDTTLVLNSGIYITPGTGRSRVAVDKSQLERLHGPMLYLTGGPTDIAHENSADDVERIDGVPVFFGSLPVGHGGTFSEPNGGDWARVSTRWLDWQLKADADASRDFSGPDCRLCSDTRWTIEQKRLPPPTGPFRESVYVPVRDGTRLAMHIFRPAENGDDAVTVLAFGRLAAAYRTEGEAPYDTFGLPWHTGVESDHAPLVPGTDAVLRFAPTPLSRVIGPGHRLRVVATGAGPRQRNLDDIRVDPAPENPLVPGGASGARIDLPPVPHTEVAGDD